MVNVNRLFGGRYLAAADLGETPRQGAIRAISIEEIGRARESKLVLTVSGLAKKVVVNKTNARALAEAFGAETNAWRGRTIEILAVPTEFGGHPTRGIRLRPISTDSSNAPAWDPPTGRTLDDEIPF
jgi:hypothetical protein